MYIFFFFIYILGVIDGEVVICIVMNILFVGGFFIVKEIMIGLGSKYLMRFYLYLLMFIFFVFKF